MTAPDDPKCATADCGHPASAHGATPAPKMAANDGACTMPDCTCKAFTPPAGTAPAPEKKMAAPDDKCATPDCGHPMSAHSDTKMAANDGSCTMLDCPCEQFTPPKVQAPVPIKGAPAAPGKGMPTAPPAPGKASTEETDVSIKDQATLQAEAEAAVDTALAAVAAVRAARLAAVPAELAPAPVAPAGAPGLPAAPEEIDGPAQPFNMPIMVLEGVDTGDGRYIRPGAGPAVQRGIHQPGGGREDHRTRPGQVPARC